MPPVRDEESETQRKAHAKRVRETRRSTQGVTLEEIKSAEQLVKRKQQQQLHQATQQLNNNDSVRILCTHFFVYIYTVYITYGLTTSCLPVCKYINISNHFLLWCLFIYLFYSRI